MSDFWFAWCNGFFAGAGCVYAVAVTVLCVRKWRSIGGVG